MGILSFQSLTGKGSAKDKSTPASGGNGVASINPFGHLGENPADWEGILILRSGIPVFIRPLNADDSGLYADFLENVTAEDRRMRFFGSLTHPSEAFLKLLVDVDHSHDAAFAAVDPSSGTMLGAVRLHSPDDLSTGEFAILVRSDLKGMGLGWALMQLIITYARMREIPEIRGSVLRENRTMLEMCEHLGFSVEPVSDDPLISEVRLEVEAAMASLFKPKTGTDLNRSA